MNIGDVYLVRLPNIEGHKQMGERPAIIIQKPQYSLKLPTVLIVPLTSKLSALNFPGTMSLLPDTTNNLDKKSAILIFQLRAIDKRRLLHKLGAIKPAQVRKLQRIINDLLGIQ